VTPVRVRRSLSHVGGKVDVGGDRALGLLLAHALDVPKAPEPSATGEPREGDDRAHVHGFHAYPARMHPVTAHRLTAALSAPSETVLDPFCGSGTVLVEAMQNGRSAVGTDLSPLAILLATAKTRPRTPRELEELVPSARRIAALADTRRKARAGATRRWSEEDVALFEPHVLLELDSLRSGVMTAPSPSRDDLAVVLSSILVKLSRQRGDTSTRTDTRRLGAGYPAKLFVRKTEELVARIRALEALVPSPRPTVRVALDDAARLSTVPDRSIDLAVTSPPYAGTYDYLAHQSLRMRWLNLDARLLERCEMGARRRYGLLDAAAARSMWVDELRAMLAAIERVLRRGASLVLLIADSAVAGQPLRADDMVASASRGTALECTARASQSRPHFHRPSADAFRDMPRAEHALLLRRR
jgi:hypothetical protein